MEETTYEPSIFDEEISVTYGGFWERFAALILDGIILAPLTFLNYFNKSSWKSVPLVIVIGLLSMAYKPVLEFLYSATPGKKALSLTVVNRSYGKIDLKDALLRNILGIIGGISGIVINIYTLGDNFLYNGTIKADAAMTGAVYSAMIVGLYGAAIGILYIADAICLIANSKKQSLHDLIAKTYVIRK